YRGDVRRPRPRQRHPRRPGFRRRRRRHHAVRVVRRFPVDDSARGMQFGCCGGGGEGEGEGVGGGGLWGRVVDSSGV
ncbi:hypothetical protein LTR91_012356, partial [Friedmanniomyces endolithicus]